MSNSIRTPWIHEYLLQVAEEHGGNLISLALETKARKGQLIQASGSTVLHFVFTVLTREDRVVVNLSSR